MPEEKRSDQTLSEELEKFRKENPKVAEAMELFGITLTKYQETLYALYNPHIYQSNSTQRLVEPPQR